MANFPTFEFEQDLHAQGRLYIAGVDEVGRGPLAGPVFAAAVILDPKHIPQGLNDSKKLSAKKRDDLLEAIMEHADVSVASASEREIEQINILAGVAFGHGYAPCRVEKRQIMCWWMAI